MTRDLHGYANRYPDVRWPGGARVAVSVVLNIEEGAERSSPPATSGTKPSTRRSSRSRARPICASRAISNTVRASATGASATLADHYGVPLTLNACARALEATPWVGADAAQRGYEIHCHGWRWEPHAGMDEAQERALIAQCVETIRRVHGKPPVGWHTKSSASVNTRRLLVEHGGFLYDSDAYNDDAPYYVQVGGKPHLVLPYAFDTNDMRFFDGYAFVRGSDFAGYCHRRVRPAVGGRGAPAEDALDRAAHADHRPAGADRRPRAGAAAHASEGRGVVRAPRGHRAALAHRGAPAMKRLCVLREIHVWV